MPGPGYPTICLIGIYVFISHFIPKSLHNIYIKFYLRQSGSRASRIFCVHSGFHQSISRQSLWQRQFRVPIPTQRGWSHFNEHHTQSRQLPPRKQSIPIENYSRWWIVAFRYDDLWFHCIPWVIPQYYELPMYFNVIWGFRWFDRFYVINAFASIFPYLVVTIVEGQFISLIFNVYTRFRTINE